MPKLTPVDHNPFAGDMGNAMGQIGQDSTAAPVSPNELHGMGMMKWLIDQGHDPLDEKFGSLFGNPEPQDRQSLGEDLRRSLTSPPQSFDPASIGAKLAPDGNHYLSDPQRAGKYLLMRN
jgi:hypothetical protein